MSRRLGGSLVGPALVARAAPCWAHGDLAQKPATSTDPVQGLGETGYGVWRTNFVAEPGQRLSPPKQIKPVKTLSVASAGICQRHRAAPDQGRRGWRSRQAMSLGSRWSGGARWSLFPIRPGEKYRRWLGFEAKGMTGKVIVK